MDKWTYFDHGKVDELVSKKYVPRFEVFPVGDATQSICTISTCNAEHAEELAALIASAPRLRALNAELVEMLQRAHNYIEKVQGPNEGGIQLDIRIALAKATKS